METHNIWTQSILLTGAEPKHLMLLMLYNPGVSEEVLNKCHVSSQSSDIRHFMACGYTVWEWDYPLAFSHFTFTISHISTLIWFILKHLLGCYVNSCSPLLFSTENNQILTIECSACSNIPDCASTYQAVHNHFTKLIIHTIYCIQSPLAACWEQKHTDWFTFTGRWFQSYSQAVEPECLVQCSINSSLSVWGFELTAFCSLEQNFNCWASVVTDAR